MSDGPDVTFTYSAERATMTAVFDRKSLLVMLDMLEHLAGGPSDDKLIEEARAWAERELC
jgi:hypothetical protein